MTRLSEILVPTPKGLYCPPGDFFIDPTAQVDRAVITHGHADHARSGHGSVLASAHTLAIMGARYGDGFTRTRQTAQLNETMSVNGVSVTLIPAGHILGSTQIVIEYAGKRLIAAGDYKRRHDPTCAPFQVMSCDVFITEATFGLPVFRHPDDRAEIEKLLASVRQFPDRTHLVGAYALGKAQRIIRLIRDTGYAAPIFIHGAMKKLCELYEDAGVSLGTLAPATIDRAASRTHDSNKFAGQIVICPPSALGDKWAQRFPDPLACFASGWMRVRARTKQRGVELPLILSDHADWDELTKTIRDIQPQELWITHGREDALLRWAELEGISARPLALIGYEDDQEDG